MMNKLEIIKVLENLCTNSVLNHVEKFSVTYDYFLEGNNGEAKINLQRA
jgi:hypothetical protein